MNFEEGFLQGVAATFKTYKELGDKTFEQLGTDDFYFRPSPESNSIEIIIQHLYGNMMSRWTNFLTEDGEKHWRKRDEEFESMNLGRQDLLSFWNGGWERLFETLNSLTQEDVTKTVTIRNESLTVYNAILRQLTHAALHVGQIITIARMIKDDQWKSLSIPKKKKEG